MKYGQHHTSISARTPLLATLLGTLAALALLAPHGQSWAFKGNIRKPARTAATKALRSSPRAKAERGHLMEAHRLRKVSKVLFKAAGQQAEPGQQLAMLHLGVQTAARAETNKLIGLALATKRLEAKQHSLPAKKQQAAQHKVNKATAAVKQQIEVLRTLKSIEAMAENMAHQATHASPSSVGPMVFGEGFVLNMGPMFFAFGPGSFNGAATGQKNQAPRKRTHRRGSFENRWARGGYGYGYGSTSSANRGTGGKETGTSAKGNKNSRNRTSGSGRTSGSRTSDTKTGPGNSTRGKGTGSKGSSTRGSESSKSRTSSAGTGSSSQTRAKADPNYQERSEQAAQEWYKNQNQKGAQHDSAFTSKNTEAEVKTVYRKLSMKHHPDKPSGSAEAFEEVTAAYKRALNRVKANATTH